MLNLLNNLTPLYRLKKLCFQTYFKSRKGFSEPPILFHLGQKALIDKFSQ